MFALHIKMNDGAEFLRVAPDTAKLVNSLVNEIHEYYAHPLSNFNVQDVFAVYLDERDEYLESLFLEAFEREPYIRKGETA